jgi:hypothetical protein
MIFKDKHYLSFKNGKQNLFIDLRKISEHNNKTYNKIYTFLKTNLINGIKNTLDESDYLFIRMNSSINENKLSIKFDEETNKVFDILLIDDDSKRSILKNMRDFLNNHNFTVFKNTNKNNGFITVGTKMKNNQKIVENNCNEDEERNEHLEQIGRYTLKVTSNENILDFDTLYDKCVSGWEEGGAMIDQHLIFLFPLLEENFTVDEPMEGFVFVQTNLSSQELADRLNQLGYNTIVDENCMNI